MKYFVIILCFSLVLGKSVVPKSKILRHDPRIVNGETATPGQFPWTVGVFLIYSPEIVFYCVGSIISQEWILTTAGCIFGAPTIVIVAGSVDLETNAVYSPADSSFMHEGYSPLPLDNDIAVVHLAKPLNFTEYIGAIPLFDEELEAGVLTTVIGFDDDLHMAYINETIIDKSDCHFYPNRPGTVCTVGDFESSPCPGDSGSPLVVGAGSDSVLVSVFSTASYENCANDGSASSSVAYYRDWIRTKTGI